MGNEASTTASSALQNIQLEIESRAGQQWEAIKAKAGGAKDASSPSADGHVKNGDIDNNIKGGGLAIDEVSELSPEQIEIIKSTWSSLQHQISSIGVLTFLHLFAQHPEAKVTFKKFENMSVDELKEDEIFAQHACRVMGVIEKVVSKLDDPESYKSYLTILGQKHVWYEAQPQHLDQMGFMFLAAIKPILEKEDRWDDDVSDAWEQLFLVVISTMRRAMRKEMSSNG